MNLVEGGVAATRDLAGSRIYAIEFSNGVVKVGRAVRVHRRMRSYLDTVEGLGIEITSVAVSAPVEGDIAAVERAAVNAVAKIAPVRRRNEYFAAIDFPDAVSAASAAIAEMGHVPPTRRPEPSATAKNVAKMIGASLQSKSAIAEASGMSRGALATKLRGERDFTVSELARIATAINVRPSEMLMLEVAA